MPVITAQTGPLLTAPPPSASAASANPVQGQGEQTALPGDWQAALAELDALLQAALPAAPSQSGAPSQVATTTAPAESPEPEQTLAVDDQTARAPLSDLHTALRRLTQHAGGEQTDKTDTQARATSDEEAQPLPVVLPVEVNAALLRQLHAIPVTARAANATAEARTEMAIDADGARSDRAARGFDQPAQFSRASVATQGNIDLIARIDAGAPGAVRIEGLTPEQTAHPFTMPAPATQSTHEWAPLKLGDKSAQWGQQLLDTLRERVEMQVNQQVKQAHIRLDPPELGRLELTVRLDGDHLSVQINANHAQLRDALLQAGDRLRAALMPQHAGGVSVDVGQGAPDDRSGQPRGDQGILAGRRSSAELEADLNELAPAGWLNTLV